MEHHLEHSIRLSEESEHKGLYEWFLQEVTREGTAKGRPMIPWPWSLWFSASAIEYRKIVEVKKAPGAEENPRQEMIRATLRAEPKSSHGGRPVLFSMFGTDRNIKDFALRISRLVNQQTQEHCLVMGIVSYTADFDFEDQTQNDFIQIDVSLNSKNFDELRGLIQNARANDELRLSLQGVEGFYSEWSPSVTTCNVKVLTAQEDEQPLLAPKGYAIQPPRLGVVREFGLMFDRRTIVLPKDAEHREAAASVLIPEEQPESSPVLPDPTLLALARVQQGVKQLRTVLWVIAALIAAGFIARWR